MVSAPPTPPVPSAHPSPPPSSSTSSQDYCSRRTGRAEPPFQPRFQETASTSVTQPRLRRSPSWQTSTPSPPRAWWLATERETGVRHPQLTRKSSILLNDNLTDTRKHFLRHINRLSVSVVPPYSILTSGGGLVLTVICFKLVWTGEREGEGVG